MQVSLLLSQHVGVESLEDLIQPKLTEPLHGVAYKGGGPPPGQGAEPLLPGCQPESMEEVSIFYRVHLYAALDEVKGHHGCVCEAAAEDAPKPTQSVVLEGSILTAVLLGVHTWGGAN